MNADFTLGGTPLLPPSYLTAYFVVFLVFLAGIYFYFSRRHQPQILWHKVKLLVVLATVLKITFLGGVGIVAAYWLIPAPSIRRTIPEANTEAFSPTERIEIVFDRPVDRGDLNKTITPDVPGRWVFEDSLYTTHLYRKLVFYPTYSLSPETTYTVNLSGIQNMIKVSEPYSYEFKFKTLASPKVASVELDDTEFKVALSGPNAEISDFSFELSPNMEVEAYLSNDKSIYTVVPKTNLEPNSQYQLRVRKTDVVLNLEDASIVERGITRDEYVGVFTTKGTPGVEVKTLKRFDPVKVVGTTPENGWTGVNVGSSFEVAYDQSVSQSSAESKFSIVPSTEGTISWQENKMIFDPTHNLPFSTKYTVTLASGVKSTEGLDSEVDYKIEFTTQNTTTKLSVPAYLQKYTLSCEMAALRMALAYRGVDVSEDTLLSDVGLDPTPHQGNIWGNPYNAFVGNVRGTQMKDGYGVYWGPIARAANKYRTAEDFQNWDISKLTNTIDQGNPVVIWVYSSNGTPTSWQTPDGQNIYAVRGEHAVVAVGFVGPPDNPSQMIINDPLAGQVYWSRSIFDKKWASFNQSGVVVY